MDFFKQLFFLLFLIQQIRSKLTNQVNDENIYEIELTKNEINKIILHTEDKLSVVLKISNSSEIEGENCDVLDSKLECKISLEISNRTDLIFKEIVTNNIFNLHIYLIQYKFNNQYCLSNTSQFADFSLSSNLLSENDILVSINDSTSRCTSNKSNKLTCSFFFQKDISWIILKVSDKNDNLNGDEKKISLKYYYSSIPTISNFFYPNNIDFTINLSFQIVSSLIEEYSIYIDKNYQITKNINDNTYFSTISKLNAGKYEIKFVNPCKNEKNIGTIYIIDILDIEIDITDIEFNENKSIKINFKNKDFVNSEMKVKLNNFIYDINENFEFTVNNTLNVGIYDIIIIKNNLLFKTNQQLIVHEKETCNVKDNIIAIEGATNIKFKLNCINITQIEKEENGNYVKLKCPNNLCTIKVDENPRVIKLKVTTWKSTNISVHIIKYIFDKKCYAGIGNSINLTIFNDEELDNKKFKLQIQDNENIKNNFINKGQCKFNFTKIVKLQNLQIIYNNTNKIPINTSDIILTNFNVTSFSPKYLSNDLNQNQKIIINYLAKVPLSKTIFKLNLSETNIINENNAQCNENQCTNTINLSRFEAKTYNLYIRNHCEEEILVDDNINVLSFIDIDEIIYSKKDNKDIIVSTSNENFFKEKGTYFVLIENSEENINITDDNKLKFSTPNITPSFYNISIKFKSEYENEYIFKTNSKLYLYSNEVIVQTPLKYLYVDQKYENYTVLFQKEIFPWQISKTEFVYEDKNISGHVNEMSIDFELNLKFIMVSQMDINIYLVNGTKMTYSANAIKTFDFVYEYNYINSKNKKILLNLEKYNQNDDKFFQKKNTEIIPINCTFINYTTIHCNIEKYDGNNITICYQNKNNCKTSKYYLYEIHNYASCIEGKTDIVIEQLNEDFNIYIKSDNGIIFNFNFSDSKYILSTEKIKNSNIYQIYIKIKNAESRTDVPIEMPFEFYKSITSNDGIIMVNINTNIIKFNMIIDDYIITSKQQLTIKLKKDIYEKESIFCFLQKNSAQCLFDLTSLSYDVYDVYYYKFCNQDKFIQIKNLKVNITEEIVIKHPIIEISESWILPNETIKSIQVKYDKYNMENFNIIRIVLVDLDNKEQSYNITYTKNKENVSINIHQVKPTDSQIYFIKTVYRENERNFTEISNYPYYLVISPKPKFTLDKHYFLKTNVPQKLTVYVSNIDFSDKISIYLKQLNFTAYFNNNTIEIDLSKELEGKYTIGYELCVSCPQLEDEDSENVIIIHGNQENFFQKVQINDCLYSEDLYYVIKIDFNNELTKEKIKIDLNNNINLVESDDNQYIIDPNYIGNFSKTNNLKIKEQKSNNVIYNAIINVTEFEIKDNFFYASKGIKLTNFSCILKNYNLSIKKIGVNETRILSFINSENDSIYYGFKDNKYIFGDCECKNTQIFSSNDLKNSSFKLTYSNLNKTKNNIIIIGNPELDFYLNNIKTVSSYNKVSLNKKLFNVSFINDNLTFEIGQINRDDVYVIESINSDEGYSSNNITNNIIGFPFYVSNQYFIFDKNQTQELEPIIVNFKTEEDLSTNILINKEYGVITGCTQKTQQLICQFSFKIAPNIIDVKINDYIDYIYEYLYTFVKGTQCQTLDDNNNATKNISIAVERPNPTHHTINIYYNQIQLTQEKEDLFSLEAKYIDPEFNKFDVKIENNFVTSLMNKLMLYEKIKVINQSQPIVIVMNTIDNDRRIEFYNTNLNIIKYRYFLYKKDNDSYGEIDVQKLICHNKTIIDFKFDLYSLPLPQKEKIEQEEVNFGYEDDCGEKIYLRKIYIINEDELDFKFERHYLSLDYNIAKVFVNGTKNGSIDVELIPENENESKKKIMNKTSPGIFIVNFTKEDAEGKYYLRYIYDQKKMPLRKNNIYFKKNSSDWVNISFDNSTHQCLILNGSDNINITLNRDENIIISNIAIHLIGNNITMNFTYDEVNDLFKLGEDDFEYLTLGEYNITINEISIEEKEMMRYNYTLTNVSYYHYYYYDNIFIKMDCQPNEFDLISSNDNKSFNCNYINGIQSGYNCSPIENITYGKYTIKVFNKFNYNTFISLYLNNLSKNDFSFENNTNVFNFTANDYYLPLIDNFTIYKDNLFYKFYKKNINFTSNVDYLIFKLDLDKEGVNYFLQFICDETYNLTLSLNLTQVKYLFEINKTYYYIKNENNNNISLNLYFKVNDNPTTPDDLINIKTSNENEAKIRCNSTDDDGTVNCNLTVFKKDNPLNVSIDYYSPSRSIKQTVKSIFINQYDLNYCNCKEKQRIDLIIYYKNKKPTIYESDNHTLIDCTQKDNNKLTCFTLISHSSDSIKIENDNENTTINLNNTLLYQNKTFTYNKSIEIGRISQEIEFEFDPNISDYDILDHTIYLKLPNETKSIDNFIISDNRTINFRFNVPSNYTSESNECYFYYFNLCSNKINSTLFNLSYPAYHITNINNTLVSPRDEEELLLTLSNQSINNISVTIGNKTEALISKSWSILDGQIACKFNLTNFKYNAQNKYQILEYTINNEITYNSTKSINIIHANNTSCDTGIIALDNGKCILPYDIEQTVNTSKQYNFCSYGKGYCLINNTEYYSCKCKNNYTGIFCEYIDNKIEKEVKFKEIVTNLGNNRDQLNNQSLVLIREIIYSIENNITDKKYMNYTLNDCLKDFSKNVFDFYNKNKTQRYYFIYTFDLAFYIMSLDKEKYINDTNEIFYLVKTLITETYYESKNKKNNKTLSKFNYSFYNSNEKDNYLPRFEYKTNKNSSNNDFNFVKLVIPRNIKNKNNESDIILIGVKTNETQSFTNITFYFSYESVINKENFDRYLKFKKYNYNIFKSDDPIFQKCFIQNNENILVDFPPNYIKDYIYLSKKITTNNNICEYKEINKEGEIIINCKSIIEKDLYVLLEDSNINFEEFPINQFKCHNHSLTISNLYKNKMSFYSIIILLIYIIFIILIEIIDPIKAGIKNDKLDEAQLKVPEQTEMSPIINDDEFDEEENVKVRQTKATFIELKKKESYFSIVFQNIFELHPLISSFRPNILTGMIYKITMFIFNLSLLCIFNVIFYNQHLLIKRIQNWEKNVNIQSFFYPLFYEYFKIIISSLLSIPFMFIMNLIILTNYDTKNRLADAISGTTIELERKDLAKDFKNKIFIRKLIGFILMILLSIASICYCIIFCFNYPRTQYCFLYSVVWSLILSWFILSPIYIFLVSHYQNNGKENSVYYMKRLNFFN